MLYEYRLQLATDSTDARVAAARSSLQKVCKEPSLLPCRREAIWAHDTCKHLLTIIASSFGLPG